MPIACSCDKTKNISLFLSDYNLWQAKHTLNVLYSQGPVFVSVFAHEQAFTVRLTGVEHGYPTDHRVHSFGLTL